MTLGRRLQELRQAATCSQSDLAARAGVSVDTLQNWEQDRSVPKIDGLLKVAAALGVSLDELAGHLPPKRPRRRPA